MIGLALVGSLRAEMTLTLKVFNESEMNEWVDKRTKQVADFQDAVLPWGSA